RQPGHRKVRPQGASRSSRAAPPGRDDRRRTLPRRCAAGRLHVLLRSPEDPRRRGSSGARLFEDMKRPFGLLILFVSCTEAPVAPPKDDGRYWLEVCAAHGYSQVETAMATGREAPAIARLAPSIRPPAKP